MGGAGSSETDAGWPRAGDSRDESDADDDQTIVRRDDPPTPPR
jgi:hypothetical protein